MSTGLALLGGALQGRPAPGPRALRLLHHPRGPRLSPGGGTAGLSTAQGQVEQVYTPASPQGVAARSEPHATVQVPPRQDTAQLPGGEQVTWQSTLSVAAL